MRPTNLGRGRASTKVHGQRRRGLLVERTKLQDNVLAAQLDDPPAADAAAEPAHFQRVADLRPQHLAHVQEPFARDHRTRCRPPAGTGCKIEVAILQ